MNRRKLKKISEHAYERYVERIMGHKDRFEIAKYIEDNRKLLSERINKLYIYSDFLHYCKTREDKSFVNIYIKDTWVLVVDKDNRKLITLFNVDSGEDKDINKEFVKIMLEKIQGLKLEYNAMRSSNKYHREVLNSQIENNNEEIIALKVRIRFLEEENKEIKNKIKNQNLSLSDKEKELMDAINVLIHKKYL